MNILISPQNRAVVTDMIVGIAIPHHVFQGQHSVQVLYLGNGDTWTTVYWETIYGGDEGLIAGAKARTKAFHDELIQFVRDHPTDINVVVAAVKSE